MSNLCPRTWSGGSTHVGCDAARRYGLRLRLSPFDPATGETKVRQKLEYPNYSGALATAGNLVFLGHYDGTFTAYDAKSLQELWSFNMGTGILNLEGTYDAANKTFTYNTEVEAMPGMKTKVREVVKEPSSRSLIRPVLEGVACGKVRPETQKLPRA